MKNNYGFGLLEMIIIMFSSLLCLVVCVIAYNKCFGNSEEVDKIEFPSIINSNENTDVIDDSINNDEEILTKQEKKYKALEDSMINGAKMYITNNYTILKDQIIVSVNSLIEEGYIKELVDPNNKKNTCKGYIIYNGNYKAYLNCEGNYISEFYDVNFE